MSFVSFLGSRESRGLAYPHPLNDSLSGLFRCISCIVLGGATSCEGAGRKGREVGADG